jgi:hypothetical protein
MKKPIPTLTEPILNRDRLRELFKGTVKVDNRVIERRQKYLQAAERTIRKGKDPSFKILLPVKPELKSSNRAWVKVQWNGKRTTHWFVQERKDI